MKKSLNVEQVKVTSFSVSDDSSTPSELPGDISFQRGCETWDFSCNGTCHYTCKGGFC